MKKITNKQKVMIRRAVFSAGVILLILVAVTVTTAGMLDMIFEPYGSIRKITGALLGLFGVGSIIGLFYIWDELILTNTYKKDKTE